jgi:hypothetical protein
MKIYDYQKFSNVYIGGSILNKEESLISIISNRVSAPIDSGQHPKEIERQERLKKRKKSFSSKLNLRRKSDGSFNNSVIILSGSVGFGSKSFEHFDEIFKGLNALLEKNNTHLLLIRGNNDDPSYFTGDKINYGNIKTIEDYSIIKLKGFNCLCVGGGISLDRKWKKTHGSRIGKTLYWEGETTELKPDEIKAILSENDIACVITHEPPSFIGNDTTSYSNSKWASDDEEVVTDAINERLVMDSIYTEMVRVKKKPYVWAFTGNSVCLHMNNIRFQSVFSSSDIICLNEIVSAAFGVCLGDGESPNRDDGITKALEKLRFTYQDLYVDEGPREVLDGDAEMGEEIQQMEEPRINYRIANERIEAIPVENAFVNARRLRETEDQAEAPQGGFLHAAREEARPFVGNYTFEDLVGRIN